MGRVLRVRLLWEGQIVTPEEIREGVRIELDGDFGLIEDVHPECFTIEWEDGSCRQTVPYNWQWLPDMKEVASE